MILRQETSNRHDMPELDDLDRRILRELQADARLTNVELAGRVGLSPSPCLRRVRLLERRGYVEGYRAVLDRAKVGLGLTVFVGVRATRHTAAEAEAFVERVLAMPNVVGCHLLSGDTDFQIEIACSDVEQYERTVLRELLAMPEIRDIRSNFSMRCYRASGPLPTGA